MAESWIERPLLPLRLSIPDFEVVRLRAIRQAHEVADIAVHLQGQGGGSRRTGSEMWVESTDGLVGGFIDMAVEEPRGLVIRDFKSGLVLDPSERGKVKSSYEIQLKLYAALYMNSCGRWPDLLELAPLAGPPVPVTFTHEECLSLLKRAAELVSELGGRTRAAEADPIRGLLALASPKQTTCRFCLYRPACPAYCEARVAPGSEHWPNDVRGQLLEIRTLGNGRLTMAVSDPARPQVTRLRGLDPDPERHPALAWLEEGCTIAASSLRSSTSPEVFSELSSTTLYLVQL